MHQIHIVEGLGLRFPNRNEDFAEGIAINCDCFEPWISRLARPMLRLVAGGR